jgi:hypothetical protein
VNFNDALGAWAKSLPPDLRKVAIHREVGDKWSIAYALGRFARDVALRQGHYDQAAASFAESLILCREAGSRWMSEQCLRD